MSKNQLMSLSNLELKQMCKNKGVKGYSQLNKEDLVKLLRKNVKLGGVNEIDISINDGCNTRILVVIKNIGSNELNIGDRFISNGKTYELIGIDVDHGVVKSITTLVDNKAYHKFFDKKNNMNSNRSLTGLNMKTNINSQYSIFEGLCRGEGISRCQCRFENIKNTFGSVPSNIIDKAEEEQTDLNKGSCKFLDRGRYNFYLYRPMNGRCCIIIELRPGVENETLYYPPKFCGYLDELIKNKKNRNNRISSLEPTPARSR